MSTFVATVALAALPENVESVPFPLPLFNLVFIILIFLKNI